MCVDGMSLTTLRSTQLPETASDRTARDGGATKSARERAERERERAERERERVEREREREHRERAREQRAREQA